MPSQMLGKIESSLRLFSIGTVILISSQFQLTSSFYYLDGGGIRGLSPLLMLREILYRIKQKKISRSFHAHAISLILLVELAPEGMLQYLSSECLTDPVLADWS